MQSQTFPSRIDAWAVVLTALIAGLLLWQAITDPDRVLEGGVTLLLMVVIGAATGYPCTYTLTDTHLLIRSGLFRQRIAYRDITAVAPSRSLWAAPALSLERVRIDFGGRFQLVSPREREAFIAELRRRAGIAA